nr:hypothetical protein [Tanacetum cinerariifolium]
MLDAIEVSSTSDLVDSLIVEIPFQNMSGHSSEIINTKYEWKPPCYDICKIFIIRMRILLKKPKTTTPTPVTDDGFVEVTRKGNVKLISSKAFGGNTCTLDSISKETGKDCNSNRKHSRFGLQTVETASEFNVMPSKYSRDDVKIYIDDIKNHNKIEFAYDYGNLNASYVNEKINFSKDYFKEIINPDYKKIDSSFQQTSTLKPYVSNVILEKIIIDLEDEVVSLLEKEKANLKTIESLKSKGFESSENDCHVVEKECDKVENPKVIAPVMFKLSVSQNVSPISMTKTSCDSKNDKNLDTFSSVRRPKHSGVIWKKKGSSNTSNVDLSSICLWIIDSGCSKHMTGNHALLTNFGEKFLETVRFGNNDLAVIAGYGDVVIGSMTIKKVYCVEDLGHNLFSVGKFCDKGLKVAFRKSTCFVRNENGVDLLTGDRSSNSYTIALNEVASNSSTCLLAKASSLQSWLWHQRLSHLNFATINILVKNNLVQGLPKMKFEKDHLCSACEQGKIHRKHHKSKTAFASNKPLYLLYMDLCGLMRVGIQRVRTGNGTEFKNKTLAKFFDEVGITKQYSATRTPQQNGIVERRNRTLVEAARTMLTFANLPLFLWAEAIATACFIQNRLIIRKCFDKTPYELMNKRKPNIKFFRVFECRCYLLNDYEDIVKSSTTDVETSINEEVFHEVSESFQGESSSSSLNDDMQQSPEEVILPQTNTQSISNNMIPNVDKASTSHNVFNERLEDAYFDASTSFHDPSNVHTFYQPYPHEKKWTKDHPLHKIIAEALNDADWVSTMQEELDQFARLKV